MQDNTAANDSQKIGKATKRARPLFPLEDITKLDKRKTKKFVSSLQQQSPSVINTEKRIRLRSIKQSSP